MKAPEIPEHLKSTYRSLIQRKKVSGILIFTSLILSVAIILSILIGILEIYNLTLVLLFGFILVKEAQKYRILEVTVSVQRCLYEEKYAEFLDEKGRQL